MLKYTFRNIQRSSNWWELLSEDSSTDCWNQLDSEGPSRSGKTFLWKFSGNIVTFRRRWEGWTPAKAARLPLLTLTSSCSNNDAPELDFYRRPTVLVPAKVTVCVCVCVWMGVEGNANMLRKLNRDVEKEEEKRERWLLQCGEGSIMNIERSFTCVFSSSSPPPAVALFLEGSEKCLRLNKHQK